MQTDSSRSPTVLVIGGAGQIGFELVRSFACLGRLVVSDRRHCDLQEESQIRQLVQQSKPDVIVNAAAYTAVDRAEQEVAAAFAVNGVAPAVLAEEARALGSLFVHYSTDYVFDGAMERPYSESDSTHPLSVYGQSKLVGEQGVIASRACSLVFRTSWVAGAHGRNFVKTILGLAQERSTLSVVADQHGAPTTAALVADVTAQVVARHWLHGDREKFPSGIYHLTADGRTTWHACAVEVLRIAQTLGANLRAGPDDVVATASRDYPTAACRPLNSLLNTKRLRETFGVHLPDWRDGIDYLLRQLIPGRVNPAAIRDAV